MIKRWMATGMLNAERSFRRVKGCKDMRSLIAALACHDWRGPRIVVHLICPPLLGPGL